MNYTQPQIDRANAVSLEDFLRTQGETLIKSGREYRWKEHDSLTVRGNKWFRHSQSKGGYVTNSEPGHGLLFFNNVILPFADDFPKDTELYKLLTTKPSEVAHETVDDEKEDQNG